MWTQSLESTGDRVLEVGGGAGGLKERTGTRLGNASLPRILKGVLILRKWKTTGPVNTVLVGSKGPCLGNCNPRRPLHSLTGCSLPPRLVQTSRREPTLSTWQRPETLPTPNWASHLCPAEPHVRYGQRTWMRTGEAQSPADWT
uniref:Uncharacterized protein n=1 Tax=Eutreptiella gymnastica TaxID=73025 RepID=A0A7S1J0X1_9EUGL